ncbi:hypothetical protein GCM10010435_84160 [Winogradskya consettensis]|uniref:Uncharacterized protein n=1 Tax=Winogradskya consettensis TaxID=113560 RepID=A0A919T2Q2_9ACTN|nr:DUF4286 family protein [Actinoplanes consettensis]GIM82110.1 hypothetical protein Aco04nite_79940 [Actinoplanes consettensis]
MSSSDPTKQREALLALSNPVDGKEEEFREWYWGTHIPELLALPGFVAAHRYQVPESVTLGVPHRYATLYEVEGSADEARTLLYTSNLSSSDSLDVTTAVVLPIVMAG